MQYPIKNEVAEAFARKFYQSLGEGKDIDEAVQAGRYEVGQFQEEEVSFARRSFGSPVIYVQNSEGIILKESEGLPGFEDQPSGAVEERWLDCPYHPCQGSVRVGANYCNVCQREVMHCNVTGCPRIIPMDTRFCDRCGVTSDKVAAKTTGESRILGTSPKQKKSQDYVREQEVKEGLSNGI